MGVDLVLEIDRRQRTDLRREIAEVTRGFRGCAPRVRRLMIEVLGDIDVSALEVDREEAVSLAKMLATTTAILAALDEHEPALSKLGATVKLTQVYGANPGVVSVRGPEGAHYFGTGGFRKDLERIGAALRKAKRGRGKVARIACIG